MGWGKGAGWGANRWVASERALPEVVSPAKAPFLSWGKEDGVRGQQCNLTRINSARGSQGTAEAFPEASAAAHHHKSLPSQTKKGFLSNVQSATTSSEHPSTAALVEEGCALKEEATCQLLRPDNSRTISAGVEQLRSTGGHVTCRHLPTN